MAVNYGARYSFGLFVQPLSAANGWSRSAVSLAASINLIAYALAGIVAGRLLVCTAARTPVELYLAYGVLYGLGSAWTGTVPVSSSVGKWFDRKRGLAVGISSMGVSFGTLTIVPLAAWVLERFTWKAGFVFLGLALLVPAASLRTFCCAGPCRRPMALHRTGTAGERPRTRRQPAPPCLPRSCPRGHF